MKILADASLPGLRSAFPKPFLLSTYLSVEEMHSLLPEQDILLCRSTLKVDANLLKQHTLHYVATASSGTDHLDKAFLAQQSITIIDAKGSNAHSVADYVEASLAYLTKTGQLSGNRAGIIGMGMVGTTVYSRLKALQYTIQTYDPLKELTDPSFKSCSKEQLFDCDLLCIHAELHNVAPYPSLNMINADFFSQIKTNCVLINAARGGIVDELALLKNPRPLLYCTDVFLNEPRINPEVVDKATLCTPHIAGHSLEAKYAAVAQVSAQLHHILGLIPPVYDRPIAAPAIVFPSAVPWYEKVLSLYNPLPETLLLKKAADKQIAFLNTRKAHQFRHDFFNNCLI